MTRNPEREGEGWMLSAMLKAAAEDERAAIVAWLRNEAAGYAFARKWRVSVALERQAAAIQSNQHLTREG